MSSGMGKDYFSRSDNSRQENKGEVVSEGCADVGASAPGAVPRSILSKDFKYVKAANTDIEKTFRRVRLEQAKAAEQAAKDAAEAQAKVRTMRKVVK